MSKCNTIQIDVDGLWTAIKQACMEELNNIADLLIKAFQAEIKLGGAGRHEWRKNAGEAFQKLSEEMAGDIIRITVGIDPSLPGDAWYDNMAAQMMVALFGNHPPIETKPNLEVFKDHMRSRGISTAKTVYPIGQFSWPDPDAENMMENAFKLTKKYFDYVVNKNIISKINFYDYVYVT